MEEKIPKRMRVAVMKKKQSFEFEERPVPEVIAGTVLIRMEYVGICGSDAHLYEHGGIGENVVKEPMVLGHEPGGVVVALGEGVSDLAVGDRVAVEPGVPCYTCTFCKEGRYNLCENVYFYASLPVTEGCFCEYIVHPANLCFRLPEHVSTLEGALMEPLAVGFHAASQSGIKVGKSAAILGAGCIGLATMLSLKSMGVNDITVIDLMENRLEKARSLGAKHTILAGSCDPVAELAKITGGGADYTFETAGNETTLLQIAKMTKRGGTITLVGYTNKGIAPLNVNWIIDNEMTIKTVFRYRNHYPTIIKAVAEGMIPLKEIASDIYEFQDIQKGFDYAIRHKDIVTKAVIRIS